MANSKEIKQIQGFLFELSNKYKHPFFATNLIGTPGYTLYAFGATPELPTGIILKVR